MPVNKRDAFVNTLVCWTMVSQDACPSVTPQLLRNATRKEFVCGLPNDAISDDLE